MVYASTSPGELHAGCPRRKLEYAAWELVPAAPGDGAARRQTAAGAPRPWMLPGWTLRPA